MFVLFSLYCCIVNTCYFETIKVHKNVVYLTEILNAWSSTIQCLVHNTTTRTCCVNCMVWESTSLRSTFQKRTGSQTTYCTQYYQFPETVVKARNHQTHIASFLVFKLPEVDVHTHAHGNKNCKHCNVKLHVYICTRLRHQHVCALICLSNSNYLSALHLA